MWHTTDKTVESLPAASDEGVREEERVEAVLYGMSHRLVGKK